MNSKEIIGRTITDILVWSKIEVDGFDEAEVFIQLDNGKFIGIPRDIESENIEKHLKNNSESLFADLSVIPIYHVNPEGKTIQEIIDAKRKIESSILGRIRTLFGFGERIPKWVSFP